MDTLLVVALTVATMSALLATVGYVGAGLMFSFAGSLAVAAANAAAAAVFTFTWLDGHGWGWAAGAAVCALVAGVATLTGIGVRDS